MTKLLSSHPPWPPRYWVCRMARWLERQRSELTFSGAWKPIPDLHFKLEDVLWGINSIVLYYANQKGTRTGEFMGLSAAGKVVRVIAHYNG